MSDQPTHATAITALLQWLTSPADGDPSRELATLGQHLTALGQADIKAEQRSEILELLHWRALAAVSALRPQLADITLPIPATARSAARNAKTTLEILAAAHTSAANAGPSPVLRLYALQALGNHLLVSALVASPPGVGIWRQMHELYTTATTNTLPPGIDKQVDEEYFRAQLLACTQPATMTARELALTDAAIASIAVLPDRPAAPSADYSGLFWIDPTQDLSATAASRKAPPPNLAVRWFACDRPAIALAAIVDAIEGGKNPATLALPEFAASTAGITALRRVIRCWSSPAKRRFHRRRQNVRAALLAGMEAVRELLRSGNGSTSEWMITNESPEGCAAMHVAGTTGRIDIGDVVALRFDGEANWQLCVARWAQSENSEHLELGLQRLAPEAAAATLVAPELRTPALVFTTPGTPPRPTLMVAAGALAPSPKKAILLTERHNLDVREAIPGACLERTACIEWHALQAST